MVASDEFDEMRKAALMSRRAFMGGTVAITAAALLGACSDGERAGNLSLERATISYGGDPNQVADLLVPLTDGAVPVVVLVHGGYWKTGFDRRSMQALADGLGRTGYAVWNIDYRRVGDDGGGWPGTFQDVAAGIDHLVGIAADHQIDLGRAAIVGHSAGGELALWGAARQGLPETEVGAGPKVRFAAAVSLAGVVDLAASATDAASGGPELRNSVVALLGGSPDQVPERYALTSPVQRVPLGLPQLLIHGALDDQVSVQQSRNYVQAATAAGDAVRLVELPAGDHLEVVRTDRPAWRDLVDWLIERVPIGPG